MKQNTTLGRTLKTLDKGLKMAVFGGSGVVFIAAIYVSAYVAPLFAGAAFGASINELLAGNVQIAVLTFAGAFGVWKMGVHAHEMVNNELVPVVEIPAWVARR